MSRAGGQGSVILEVMCAAAVLDKENRADSDWLFLMYWLEFMGNLL